MFIRFLLLAQKILGALLGTLGTGIVAGNVMVCLLLLLFGQSFFNNMPG